MNPVGRWPVGSGPQITRAVSSAPLVKPYVQGVGFNALSERPWSEIEILEH